MHESAESHNTIVYEKYPFRDKAVFAKNEEKHNKKHKKRSCDSELENGNHDKVAKVALGSTVIPAKVTSQEYCEVCGGLLSKERTCKTCKSLNDCAVTMSLP